MVASPMKVCSNYSPAIIRLLERASCCPKRAGCHSKRAGRHPKRSGSHSERAGRHPKRAGFHSERAGRHPKRAGSHSERAGHCPKRAGTLLNLIQTKKRRRTGNSPVLPLYSSRIILVTLRLISLSVQRVLCRDE